VAELRHLVLVLGDQLDLDAAQDAVWMAEVIEEATHVWSSKPRTVLFLAAMRHFAQALRAGGRPLHTPGWTTPPTTAACRRSCTPTSNACAPPAW
jgi:deoxyribodipyrimidine photolyase-related protein